MYAGIAKEDFGDNAGIKEDEDGIDDDEVDDDCNEDNDDDDAEVADNIVNGILASCK
jgi:hypothetical protein